MMTVKQNKERDRIESNVSRMGSNRGKKFLLPHVNLNDELTSTADVVFNVGQ